MEQETQTREYKSSWRDEWLKWICGFANAQGGVLEIGRNDHGDVVGLPDAGRLLEDIPNKITSTMGIVAEVDLRAEGERQYLVITVPKYSNAISYHGSYYMRSGATNRELNGSALVDFILRKQGRTWDSIPIPGVRVGDLDPIAFRDFRRKALSSKRLSEADLDMSDAALLEALLPAEDDMLSRAAVLAFHENPERFARGAYVKIGRIDKDLLYYDEIRVPLVSMVDTVLDTIYLKYFHQAIHYEGIYRVETYPVPRRALREAITNAVLHKDYSDPNPVQINVFSDEITIYNPGVLYAGWSVDDLPRLHQSWLRNPDLARVFFRSGQIEAWGRGILRIQEACAAEDSPGPVYRLSGDALATTFPYNPVWLNADPRGAAPYADDGKPSVDVSTTTNVGADVGDFGADVVTNFGMKFRMKFGINDTQSKALALIAARPHATALQIGDALGITERQVQSIIAKLKSLGLITRDGARRNGRWIVSDEARIA